MNSRGHQIVQVHKDAMSYEPGRLDFLFVHPPPALVQASVDHLVRRAVKAMYVYHLFNDRTVKEALLNDLCDFRILVGTRKWAFTEAPCRGNDKRRHGKYFDSDFGF